MRRKPGGLDTAMGERFQQAFLLEGRYSGICTDIGGPVTDPCREPRTLVAPPPIKWVKWVWKMGWDGTRQEG